MTITLFDAIEKRRSIYALGKTKIVEEQRIKEIVEFAVKHIPSPFNSQTARLVVLFGKESNKFWSLSIEALRKILPLAEFASTEKKMKGFDSGYGTILFFEEQEIIDGLMARFPSYHDKFPIWSIQSNGMLEFAVWTALEAEGLGASLQHYNPVVDADVKKEWNLPESWNLLAEMPFGSIEAPADKKEFSPLENRVLVYS